MKRSEAQQGLKVRCNYDPGMRGIIIATETRQGTNFVVIEWEEGKIVEAFFLEDLTPVKESDGSLEREFENLMESIGEQIQAHLNLARESLFKATELADAHGIPFFTHVSELGQSYVPYSFRDKWADLDRNYVADLTEIDKDELNNARGWRSSAIC